MGLFDIPAPLYSAIDSLLGFLPLYTRLLFWAAVTGAISMALYWACSTQGKVEAAKHRAIDARRKMASYDGTEIDEMLPLAKESLVASGKHFWIVLLPAVASSLPALTLIIWVSANFGYDLPTAGTSVTISSAPVTAIDELSVAGNNLSEAKIIWPSTATQVNDADGELLLSLPLEHPVPIVHQRLWWNSLIGNPNGYLPERSSVQEIRFDLPGKTYLNFGPDWIRTWEMSYFLLLIAVSLGIKVAFKIH